MAIAGTDLFTEGTWSDSFTTITLDPQPTFGVGEPNGGTSENCLAVWHTVTSGVADVNCDQILPYALCEATSKKFDLKFIRFIIKSSNHSFIFLQLIRRGFTC